MEHPTSINQAIVKKRNDAALRGVIDEVRSGLAAAIGSFVNQPISLTHDGELQCIDLAEWRDAWTRSRAVVRGGLGGSDNDHGIVLTLDIADTITLCGHLMLASNEVVASARDAMLFGPDEQEAFAELGNVLCTTVGNALRRRFGAESGLRIKDFALMPPAATAGGCLGEGIRLAYGFKLQIGSLPATAFHLLLDFEVGQGWNDGVPLFTFFEEDPDSDDETPQEDRPPSFDNLPTTRRRSRLSAFVNNLDTAALIRKVGRKLGLEVQRYARTDVPNPAAHTDDIVLIEIPVGEEKRFDWAKRLRHYHRDIPVVLLIHQPSRPRVVQGLLTRSNAILAWPSKEAQLRDKIEPLVAIQNDDSES